MDLNPAFPDIYDPNDNVHVPRKRGEARYGVGFQDKPGSFGMVAGPYEELRQALEYYPSGRKEWFIFHLDQHDSIPLYRWQRSKDVWRRIKTKRRWAYHPGSDSFAIVPPHAFECEDLGDLGPAITYRREELRKLIADNWQLMAIYERVEDIDDIPF